MQDWQGLEGEGHGRAALVLGNGPSRDGREDVIRRFQGILIACNGYWKEFTRDPDYTVAFDRPPIEDFLRHAPENLSLLVPDPFGAPATKKVPDDVWVAQAHRTGTLWRARPFCSNQVWSQGLGTYCTVVWSDGGPIRYMKSTQHILSPGNGWHPRIIGWGNLSGMIAFQLAMMLGCDPIYLLGIDVAGVAREDGTVRLTARCPDRDPLDRWTVRREHTEEVVPGWHRPVDWQDTPSRHWRDLIGCGAELGRSVLRLCGGGSLDWVPEATEVDSACREQTPRPHTD